MRAQAGLVRTFQSLELFEDLSVRDNLLVAGSQTKWYSFLLDMIHRTPREVDALADTGSHPVFCPTSNLLLGSGLFDFAAAAAAGMARVATARGTLLCWVRIADGIIADCAMVPAGAWNFHPDGPFCREAMSGPETGEDLDGARKRLTVLALALDPSIAHTVDVIERAPGTKRA